MKKILLGLFLFLFSSIMVYSVPAYPGLITTIQPDGSTISFYLRGDENFSFKMSEDGYLLTLNEDGVFEYADFRDNDVIPLGVKASDIKKRTVEELNFLQNAVKVSDIQLGLQSAVEFKKRQKINRDAQRALVKYPTTGSPKSLVILVNFQDIKFLKETANEDFSNMLNMEGYSENGATSSAREYFRVSSFNQFDPNFVVVGPYDLPEKVDYYGKNGRMGAGSDIHAADMILHACSLADEAGLDFTEFDTDSNGILDNVFVYYAGHNEAEYGGEDKVWPHRGTILGSTYFDGVKISGYACSSELKGKNGDTQCGIGTFVHEFGHVLELPDLYVTDYSHDEPTLYKWDVMDQGPYNNEGRTPPTYSAYERFFCGWLKPEPIDSISGVHILEPLITSNKAYILSKTKHNMNGYNPDPKEFFILENRQKIGIDSLALPGEDMLITHINYKPTLWMMGSNNPNRNPNDMCVQIECAAGTTTKDAKRNTFPGADNVVEFEFEFKDNQIWETPILGILKKDRNVSFMYGDINEIPQITFANSLTDFYTYANKKQYKDLDVVISNIEGDVKFSFENTTFYTIAQRQADGTISEPKEELIINIPSKEEHVLNLVVVFYSRGRTSNDEFFETRILAETDNFISVLPLRGKSRRVLEVSIPTAFEAKNITDNSFVASWSFDKKATGYYLSVYNKDKNASEEIETFDSFAEGNNPKAWYYNFLTTDSINYASSPLSLAFTSKNDTLWTKDYILPVSSLDFWIASKDGAKGNVIIEAFVDSVWTSVFNQHFDEQINNQTITVDLDRECYKFRLYVEFDTNEGRLLFDDFVAKFDYTLTYIMQDEEFLQEEDVENQVIVSNYNPKKNYYYRVRATDKQTRDEEGRFENITDFSNEVCVGDDKNKEKNNKVEPLSISFIENHFVVNLKELHENYVIYIYSADGSLVEEIEPTSKKVVLPRLDANMYVVKYSEKGKVSRKDQVGKIFY